MPNTFQNKSFEAENPSLLGTPEDWNESVVSNGMRQALYGIGEGPDYKPPYEQFENDWNNLSYLFLFDDLDLDVATYDSSIVLEDFEDYEEGWFNNQDYLFELVSIQAFVNDGQAFIDSSISDTYNLPDGTNHSITTDLGTANTGTIVGDIAKYTTSGFTDPTLFSGQESIDITIGTIFEAETRTVIFFIADQTINDVVTRINNVINPLVGTSIGEAFIDGSEIRFEAIEKGTDSFLLIEGDPAVMTILGLASFPPQGVNGTGNVGNLSEITTEDLINALNTPALETIGVGITYGESTDVLRFSRTQHGTGTIEFDSPGSDLTTALGITTGVTVGPTGISPVDETTFEQEWNNTDYDFAIGSLDAAGTQTFEPGNGWSNDTYQYVLGSTDRAEYYNDTRDQEDFEDLASPFDFISTLPNFAIGEITIPSHGLNVGERVAFLNEGGRLPSGMSDSPVESGEGGKTEYPYVVESVVTPNIITLNSFVGGPLVTFDDAGTGVHYLLKDTNLYWTKKLNI